jgi:hypothetical protein
MHHRQMAPIARRMQGRCGARDVFTDDGDVADLAVAQAELVVGQADGAGIVRALGLFQRLGQEGDAARRLAARNCQPAVHAPQVRKPNRIHALASLGRRAEGLGRLPKVVFEQPGLGQRTPDVDLVIARQARLPERAQQERRGFGAVPLLEHPHGLVELLGCHRRRVYMVYRRATAEKGPWRRGRAPARAYVRPAYL